MQINQAEEWQRLTEHYRGMLDGELEQLAESFGDLTETAQQVLRNELRSRGLDGSGSPKTAARYKAPSTSSRFASDVDPDANIGQAARTDGDEEDDSPTDYTWKTLLCECDTSAEAYQLKAVLQRAGIDSWVEVPGSSRYSFGMSSPRVVVAADQLEQAIEIANQPIPKEILEASKIEVPAYVPPTCPKCGTEDPVLESAEPTNAWLCEACGAQWSDPEADAD
ncbi:MAG: hypothetical protein ABSG96_17430 [Terracidiphilus sp.]|jgi:hypothetical protein